MVEESERERAAAEVRGALEDAARGLVDREHLVELIVLATIAGEHLLVVGPPGTAKSEAARRAAHAFEARYFEYLLGRFTEPSELVGPVDLRKLREGRVEIETTGMLPEAEIAFLDEVFLGSTAILNTLLGVLNERTFRRGHTTLTVPLRVCIAASNAVPDEPSLAAFADRFLVHAYVEPVSDPRLEELLAAGDARRVKVERRVASLRSLDVLTASAREIALDEVRPAIAQVVRLLRGAGVVLSDRRVVRAQRLVAAAAALDGRSVADARDLWPLAYAVPGAANATLAKDVLRGALGSSSNGALPHAAFEASASVAARADAFVRAWSETIETCAAQPEAPEVRARLEALLRTLDATFAATDSLEALHALRVRAVALHAAVAGLTRSAPTSAEAS